MNRLLFYLLLPIYSSGLSGQAALNDLYGKTLVNRNYGMISFINDSIVFISQDSWHKDTLFYILSGNHISTYKQYSEDRKTNHGDFYIHNIWVDSLELIDPGNFIDTYVDISKYMVPINDFKVLEINYWNPFSDYFRVKIRIDSQGKYYEKSTLNPSLQKPFRKKNRIIKQRLDQEQFEAFITDLSVYYILYLPEERGCGIDEASCDFLLVSNNKTVVSRGCRLSLIHEEFLHKIFRISCTFTEQEL